jgi:hypothetical protein
VAIRTPRRALEKTMSRAPIESRLIERAVTSPVATGGRCSGGAALPRTE